MFEAQDKRLSCRHCGKNNTTPELCAALNALSLYLGFEPQISSGTRCESHNRAVGGAPHSRHLSGRAVDITGPPKLLEQVAALALKAGFARALPNHKRLYIHLDL